MYLQEIANRQFSPLHVHASPTINFQLFTPPDNLDLLVVFDYQAWVNNLDDEEEEPLLSLTPENYATPTLFQRVNSNLYYVIGYVDGDDILHQLIHIPRHVDHFYLRINENFGNYEFQASPGVQLLEQHPL